MATGFLKEPNRAMRGSGGDSEVWWETPGFNAHLEHGSSGREGWATKDERETETTFVRMHTCLRVQNIRGGKLIAQIC